MELRRLGTSGLLVSAVGLGTNNFGSRLDQRQAAAVVDAALDLGVTLFDTADIYGGQQSEVMVGSALGARRPGVLIATKFRKSMGHDPYLEGGSRRWIMQAVEGSLRRLQTDWIDLYQMHAPDPGTPILETLQALDDLVRAGKVRYIGLSNLAGWEIADAWWTATHEHLTRPVSAQDRYSLLSREVEAEVLPACARFGLGLLPYYPLEAGFLTGKYRSGRTPAGVRLSDGPLADDILTEANYNRLEMLDRVANASGLTLLEMAIGWLLSRPQVSSVITGASTPEQLNQNVEAAERRLDAAQLAELEPAGRD